jgi:hypothetical protein
MKLPGLPGNFVCMDFFAGVYKYITLVYIIKHRMCVLNLSGSFKYSALVFIVLFSACTGHAQNKDSIIKSIRQTFQQINNDKTLNAVELENEDFMDEMTDGGGSLKGYFKGDTICKIHLWIGLSFGVRQFDYYFDHGKLCFVYESEEDFPYDEKKGTLNPEKLVPAFEGRYYIHSGKLIEVKAKGRQRAKNEDESASLKQFNTDAESYSGVLRKHLKE